MPDDFVLPMDQSVIEKYIPHRDPFLFVSRITALEENSITIESDIKPDAVLLQGHFPGKPILPGVIIVETVAQAAALIVGMKHGVPDGKFVGFSAIDSAKFKRPVYPNETISVELTIEKKRLPFYKFSSIVKSGDNIVAIVKIAAALMDLE